MTEPAVNESISPVNSSLPEKNIANESNSQGDVSQSTEPLRYAVQVAGFVKEISTTEYVAKLTEKGYKPFVQKTQDSQGRTWHFIWIGRFKDHSQAVTARDTYQKNEGRSAFIRVLK